MKATRLVMFLIGILAFTSPSLPQTNQPQGQLYYFSHLGSGTYLYSVDLAAPKPKRIATLPDYAGYDFIVSPDRRFIGTYCIIGNVGETWILTTDGRLVKKIPGECTDWSNDGRTLVGLEAPIDDNSKN